MDYLVYFVLGNIVFLVVREFTVFFHLSIFYTFCFSCQFIKMQWEVISRPIPINDFVVICSLATFVYYNHLCFVVFYPTPSGRVGWLICLSRSFFLPSYLFCRCSANLILLPFSFWKLLWLLFPLSEVFSLPIFIFRVLTRFSLWRSLPWSIQVPRKVRFLLCLFLIGLVVFPYLLNVCVLSWIVTFWRQGLRVYSLNIIFWILRATTTEACLISVMS